MLRPGRACISEASDSPVTSDLLYAIKSLESATCCAASLQRTSTGCQPGTQVPHLKCASCWSQCRGILVSSGVRVQIFCITFIIDSVPATDCMQWEPGLAMRGLLTVPLAHPHYMIMKEYHTSVLLTRSKTMEVDGSHMR